MKRKSLEIYIHIPFCVKKCDYCDFLSYGIGDKCLEEAHWSVKPAAAVPEDYVDRLCKEMAWYGKSESFRQRPVTSVFIGGGTPSLLSETQIFKLMAGAPGLLFYSGGR